MISRLTITNFKSIGEPGVDLELKPLTCFVGPNGGGKSSIVEALIFASLQGLGDNNFLVFQDINDLHFKQHPTNRLAVEVYFDNSKKDSNGAYIVSHDSRNGLKQVEEHLAKEHLFFKKIYLLQSTRGSIEAMRGPGEANWVGRNGQHTLDILERMGGAKHQKTRDKIQRWAVEFGLGEVAAAHEDRERIAGSYIDRDFNVPLNLYLASAGSRQVLTVIVQLFWAEPSSTIIIEEPEISLHPEGQVKLLQMFGEAIKETKQIILTTHSLFLLQAIGYAVQEGWLKRDAIAVYHVEKNTELGTQAGLLPLDESGFIKGWVPSFSEVEKKLMRAWADTLSETA